MKETDEEFINRIIGKVDYAVNVRNGMISLGIADIRRLIALAKTHIYSADNLWGVKVEVTDGN